MPFDFSLILKVKHEYFCPGPGVINFFSCSTQLSMQFILLINVKMPTIVGILTFINRIKARKIYIFQHFKFNFNISEKSANGQGKCDPSHTEDESEQNKGELSDSEKSKSETSDSGASHVNDGSFFKMEKTDNAFRFQFDIEGKT